MNPMTHRRQLQRLLPVAAVTLLLLACTAALAAPGAHGPNGEHLDGPTAQRAVPTLPRVEAYSEAFELVAELRAGELAIVVDRYETNEPVLGAGLEVESGSLKAVATFRAGQGDYAVTDPEMLKALSAPGEHGVIFTLVAGADSDLLDGTLVGMASGAAATARHDRGHTRRDDDHWHAHELERAAWAGAALAALGLMGGFAWWRRRDAVKMQGGL